MSIMNKKRMSVLKTKVCGNFYRFTVFAIFTIIGRAVWYLKMIFAGRKSWKAITKKIDSTVQVCSEFNSVKILFGNFKYQYNGLIKYDPEANKIKRIFGKWPTWKASVRIIFFRGIKGNCEDAEVYSKWLINNYNRLGFGYKAEYQQNIYLPLKVSNWDKAHYFATVKSHDKEYQFSNGKITVETRDKLAKRYLNKGVEFTWL